MRYPFSVIVIGVAQNQPIPIRKATLFAPPTRPAKKGFRISGIIIARMLVLSLRSPRASWLAGSPFCGPHRGRACAGVRTLTVPFRT